MEKVYLKICNLKALNNPCMVDTFFLSCYIVARIIHFICYDFCYGVQVFYSILNFRIFWGNFFVCKLVVHVL